MLRPATLLATLPLLATLALHTGAQASATGARAREACFFGIDATFSDFASLSRDAEEAHIELFLDGEPCLTAVVGRGVEGYCAVEAVPGSVCRAVGPLALSPECLDQGEEMFLHFTLERQGHLFDGREHRLDARIRAADVITPRESPIRLVPIRDPYGTGVCHSGEAAF
ncbi:hypothetical protein [Polyangium aurulentum]|uniref:hypothetical protein n=1 Tax=Polyangium aurulentum TaxID=2567896 RepID=UPI0010AEB76B|nr:hypothetical protein [Polyangium aurulentum]UQA58650.1 hypothetical protein E8A73_046685 [Polyangium aurulentum]